MELPGQPGQGAPAVRVGDADRDRVAGVLAEALAGGFLDPQEHAERLEAAYAARTEAALAPLTADLPTGPGEPGTTAATVPVGEPMTALFSKLRRGGAWPVPPHSVARARFGALVLDLRQAVFTRHEVVLQADSFCGKIVVIVPQNAQVYDTGSALFGKRSLPGARGSAPGPDGAEGPVIRITGRSVLGHIRVHRAGSGLHGRLLEWLDL
ncbi:DUF1707 domain-containing protein [Streptacidiphilus sp. PB12-B1b]|nr:DUF1707 domain-containing protein [Streptacidiphilus sp. PB12-B1b]